MKKCKCGEEILEAWTYCHECEKEAIRQTKKRYRKKRKRFIKELRKEVDDIIKAAEEDRALKSKYSIRISSPYR